MSPERSRHSPGSTDWKSKLPDGEREAGRGGGGGGQELEGGDDEEEQWHPKPSSDGALNPTSPSQNASHNGGKEIIQETEDEIWHPKLSNPSSSPPSPDQDHVVLRSPPKASSSSSISSSSSSSSPPLLPSTVTGMGRNRHPHLYFPSLRLEVGPKQPSDRRCPGCHDWTSHFLCSDCVSQT